jgi:hypothetical protein
VSGCGTGATDPVAQAATLTSQVPGSRVAMTISLSIPGAGAFSIPGTGVFDLRHRSGRLDLDFSKLAALAGGRLGRAGDATVEERIVYPDLYIRAPFLSRSIPGGKRWIKLDLAAAGRRLLGANPTQLLTQNSPADELEQLRATSGDVHRVGADTVRGVRTTHYRATLDLRKLPDRLPAARRAQARQLVNRLIQLTGTSTVPVDVWVDARRLVRRMRVAYSFRPTTGQTTSRPVGLGVTIDFFDFGAKRAIEPPPSGQVFDATNSVSGQAPR